MDIQWETIPPRAFDVSQDWRGKILTMAVNYHYFSASEGVHLQNKFTFSAICSYVDLAEIDAMLRTC